MQRDGMALIGYTGFVGSNILSQQHFDYLYNSKNIEVIRGKNFDILVCAGAPGTKWLANKEPEKDLATISQLIENLKETSARICILISTIDVYSPAVNVREDTSIDIEQLSAYGKHRLMLEKFVSQHFDSLIIRLPAIFGVGLKKNMIYDLLHNNLQPINNRSTYQFYFLGTLWKDIRRCLLHNLHTVNFATEPIGIEEIAREIFGIQIPFNEKIPPVHYDMQTNYASLWEKKQPYLYSMEEVKTKINIFVKDYQL